MFVIFVDILGVLKGFLRIFILIIWCLIWFVVLGRSLKLYGLWGEYLLFFVLEKSEYDERVVFGRVMFKL